ncbi:MAG: undecaprenyl/decaprenyl-phosphate alpha-N-acetylglucosaminyl 1-phosphate transferase [Gemmatimonadetes bacterium]|nr:undecaprenyl/decaprenyl-phosphate alpha-N-acetylglucosaminyl 1-phosphate transferase [Gemmatimonadota bacterium]
MSAAPILGALCIALFTALGLTPVVGRFAERLGIVDKPGPRKVHESPVPLLGGLAIFPAAVVGALLFPDPESWVRAGSVLAGGALLLAVGILDDLGLLHHQIKLLIAMPAASLMLVASGVAVPPPGSLFAFSLAATVLWLVGITAAFSILDHLDGVCAGIAAIAAAFFLLCGVVDQRMEVMVLAASLMGAALGFLRWNFNPAKIFMGDGGAMFLGFVLAALGLQVSLPGPSPATGWLVPVLILGVPIFDTALVIVSRLRRGLVPFASPGKDHTAHRLAKMGMGPRRVALLLYAAAVFCGSTALLVRRLPVLASYSLVGALGAVALIALVLLERAPYERQEGTHWLRGRRPAGEAMAAEAAYRAAGARRDRS